MYANKTSPFSGLAFEMMKANGSAAGVAAAANSAKNLSEGLRQVLKAVAASGRLDDPDFGESLTAYNEVVDSFIESLRNASVFDQILPNMRQLPLRTRIAAITYAITGSQVQEGLPKPVSQLSIDGSELTLRKATAIIVLAKELFVNAGSAAQALLARELRNTVVTATDKIFVEAILADVTPINSAGGSVANILSDLEALIAAVSLKSLSSPYFLTDSYTAGKLATKPSASGEGFAFPQVGPMGGILAGVPLLVTDALEATSDGSQLVLLDAQGIAGNSDTIILDASSNALLELETTPDNPTDSGTVMTSLFQSGMRALRAERYLGAEVIRENAVAVISGVQY